MKKGAIKMLEKIKNRKTEKAIKEIEELIEYEKGRRAYYEQDLRMGIKIHEAKSIIHMIEYHDNRIGALQDALRIIHRI
jgi:hypothetical protein